MAWLKRLASPEWWRIERKTKKFTIAPRGPHCIKDSIPLGIIIRDILKLAETSKEAKSIIKRGGILVDKKVCKRHNHGVGLMDVIEISSAKKSYRIIPTKKGLDIIAVPADEAMLKLCKIKNKTIVKKGRVQLNLYDGKNILTADKSYKTNDSLLLRLPDKKIVEHLKFEGGALVLVTKGSNRGKIARLSKIEVLRSTQPNRVWLTAQDTDTKTFEAPFDSAMVIGKEKPIISLDRNEGNAAVHVNEKEKRG